MLEPDHMRGIPLDMDQYTRLFGTARIPTEVRRVCLLCSPYAPVLCTYFTHTAGVQDGGAL